MIRQETHVLIVDDDEVSLRSTERDLKDRFRDWDISTASGIEAAKARISERAFDVIITDLVLSEEPADQGGMEVIRAARERDAMAMVILITGKETSLDRYGAFDAGAFECLQRNMINLRAADEIAIKAKAALRIRQLALSEVANEKKMALMGRYFPRKGLSALEDDPRSLDLAARTLTIAFWDIQGFSLLCEIIREVPVEVADFLAEYFSMMESAIEDAGGIVDKFIGDGVMGLFGALGEISDGGQADAVAAIRAGLVVREQFEAMRQARMRRWRLLTPRADEINIGLRCGVHTGVNTLVGKVGTQTRDQYTALGPHVNLAARLEGRAEAGQLLVSSTTAAHLEGKFEVSFVDVLEDVKNIPGHFRVYSVTGPTGDEYGTWREARRVASGRLRG